MTVEYPVERCPECGGVYKMEYIGPPEDPHAHSTFFILIYLHCLLQILLYVVRPDFNPVSIPLVLLIQKNASQNEKKETYPLVQEREKANHEILPEIERERERERTFH